MLEVRPVTPRAGKADIRAFYSPRPRTHASISLPNNHRPPFGLLVPIRPDAYPPRCGAENPLGSMHARHALRSRPRLRKTEACVAAHNSFGIRTYTKIGLGGVCSWFSDLPASTAKSHKICTYAMPKAKRCRMCTYTKIGGGGYLSPASPYAA
jgi:hypothetical protein